MRKLVYIEHQFKTFFQGFYIPDIIECEPHPLAPKYEKLGVTKLVWREDTNTLIVHLQSPGLLIGERGKTIDALKKYMNCNIEIVEVKSLIEKYTPEPKTVSLDEILDWIERKTTSLELTLENCPNNHELKKLVGQNELLTEIVADIKKKFNYFNY